MQHVAPGTEGLTALGEGGTMVGVRLGVFALSLGGGVAGGRCPGGAGAPHC